MHNNKKFIMSNSQLIFPKTLKMLSIFLIVLHFGCSGGDGSNSDSTPSPNPEIIVNDNLISFGQVYINTSSESQSLGVIGNNLTQPVNISVSGPYKISLDDIDFVNNVQLQPSPQSQIFIKFFPTEKAQICGELSPSRSYKWFNNKQFFNFYGICCFGYYNRLCSWRHYSY